MNKSREVESAGRWERGSQAASPAMLSRGRAIPLRRVALTEMPTLENPSPSPNKLEKGSQSSGSRPQRFT
jgi:hypothetical protein